MRHDEHRDGGRLARAVRAEQPEDRALGDLEAHAVDGGEVAVALHEVADLDDRSAGGPFRTCAHSRALASWPSRAESRHRVEQREEQVSAGGHAGRESRRRSARRSSTCAPPSLEIVRARRRAARRASRRPTRGGTAARPRGRRRRTPGWRSPRSTSTGSMPSGRSKVSPCQWPTTTSSGQPAEQRLSDRRRRVQVAPGTSRSRAVGARRTRPPSTSAMICAPRHTPSTSRPAAIASAMKRFSADEPRARRSRRRRPSGRPSRRGSRRRRRSGYSSVIASDDVERVAAFGRPLADERRVPRTARAG